MPRFMLCRTVMNVVAALTTTVSRMTTRWEVPIEEKVGGKDRGQQPGSATVTTPKIWACCAARHHRRSQAVTRLILGDGPEHAEQREEDRQLRDHGKAPSERVSRRSPCTASWSLR